MKCYKYIHYLSLDVCVGALAYQAYFYYLKTNHFVSISLQVLLFCCIWMVYLVDRMIDARLDQIDDARHHFIVQHTNKIYLLFIILGLGIGYIISTFDSQLILQGVLLFFLLLGYWLVWIKKWFRKWLSKEILTSLIYSLGILFPFSMNINGNYVLNSILFFFIVLHHLKLFLHLVGKKCPTFLLSLELLIAAGLFFQCVRDPQQIFGLIPLIITLGVQVMIHYIYPSVRMRAIAEAAYWSPFIVILYELF